MGVAVAQQAVTKLLRNILRLSCLGSEKGPHITRYYMYQHLGQVVQTLGTRSGRMLSISHSQKLCDLFGANNNFEISEANYPDCNMLSLPFADGEFDVVVSDQVLEHLEGNPQQAIDESYRVLKEGGIAIHTTCLLNPIHSEPGDFWRFTPDGLRLLSKKFSQIIDCSGFGNAWLWIVVWLGLRFEPIPKAAWHPLNRLATLNDHSCPVSTWIVARK